MQARTLNTSKPSMLVRTLEASKPLMLVRMLEVSKPLMLVWTLEASMPMALARTLEAQRPLTQEIIRPWSCLPMPSLTRLGHKNFCCYKHPRLHKTAGAGLQGSDTD
ncbi:hypothetical protein GGH15_005962 [Coemansia sp. RSA 562]|nr:hypothetical protein GGH15_005962 [Coemansia sp. RSA 562]